MALAISWSDVVLSNRMLLGANNTRRPCHQKAIDIAMSVLRQCRYWAFFFTQKNCPYAHQINEQRQWTHESRGLCVLLHGLRSHPVAWHSQVSLLQKEPRVDFFVPFVLKKGMCSLEEAAQAILPTILDYARKNPKRPICILGHSNGSRLAMWLEINLRRNAPTTPVKVSTIAGVHFGSSRMQLLKQVGIAACFYPDVLRDELSFGSNTAKQLLGEVLAPLPERVAPRDYEFYATPTDVSVPDLGSSLPRLKKGERIHILHGHSHDSIVGAVAKQQIESCLRWISNPSI